MFSRESTVLCLLYLIVEDLFELCIFTLSNVNVIGFQILKYVLIFSLTRIIIVASISCNIH